MIEQAPKCDGCRQIYSERIPSENPPCENCKERLLDENLDAIFIFFIVIDQMIMGLNGPIGINHQAIHEAMRLYKIQDKRKCFEKVNALSKWYMSEIVNKGK